MKIKNRLVSAMLSLVTGLSMLSLLPPTLVSAAGLSYDKVVDWSETTYNYINGTDTGTGIINGVTSLSVNNGQKKYNSETRTGLKSNWNDIFKSGYTFNFEKNVKPDDMTIVLFQQDNQGNWVKSYDVPLNDDFLNKINELNQKVNEICGTDGQEYFVDYSTDENKGKYYGVDEPQREVTRKALWTIDSNTGELFQDKKVETKSGYSAFDSRSCISIGHDVKRDYFIKLPDANKCKIGMLYKNGGSQLNENGVPELLDVLVYCNDYDFLNEAVPYMSSSNVVDKSANGDEDYAYLTDEMVELLIANGLAESEFSLENEDTERGVKNPIYRKLPNPISKRYVIMGKERELKALIESGNPPSIYDKTYYGVRTYNYVVPYYMISHVTEKTIPYAGSIRYNGDVVERIVPLRNGSVTVNWDGIEVNAFELIERQSYDDYYVYGNINALKWRNSWVNYHVTDITTSCLRYTEGKPGISVGFGTWFDMRHEFYKPGAYDIESPNFRDNRINVKGYSCWKDVDEQQGVSFLKNGAVQDKIINSNGRSIVATGAWIGDETGHSSMYGCHTWTTVESPSEKPLLYTADDIVDEKDKSKIGFLKPTDKSYIGRYDWSNELGQQLMGYFDYSTQNAIPEETESNWLFATFDTANEKDVNGNLTSQLQLYYTFWGAIDGSYNKLIESCESQTNCQSRFNAFSSGWMMCDFPTLKRNFTANYRLQKTVKDENGTEVPITCSQYGSSPDNPSFDIGFVLTDADGKVCLVRKLDDGKYAYVKTINSTNLTRYNTAYEIEQDGASQSFTGELIYTNDKDKKYSTLKGIVTLTNLPRGEYRLVEAVVTHQQDNNEQPIPFSKMIFSDALATGNQFGKQLNITTTFTPAGSNIYGAAIANVDENGNVSVMYKGDTIHLKTTVFDVSPLLDFAKDEQDYIAVGEIPMLDKNGNQQISSVGEALNVNSRITNETEIFRISSLKVKKIAKDIKGNDVSNQSNTSGIVFNLKGRTIMGDEVNLSATTGSDGYAVFTNLQIGKYTVTEDATSVSKLPYDSNAPFGWSCDLTGKEVIIEYGESIKTIEFFNAPVIPGTGTIEVLKKDANNAKRLKGAEFTLYNGDKIQYRAPLETSDTGITTFTDLPKGLYYIKETKAPEGYVINDTYYPVEITDETLIANNGILKLDIENSLIRGSIKLTKVNSEKTGMKLSGAIFRVYKDVDGDGKYNSEVDTAFGTMSENNGVYSTSANVPYGKYIVKEAKAPTGYYQDTKDYPVNITENGKVYVVANIPNTQLFGNKPKPVSITLTKRIPVDEVNGGIWFEHGNPTFVLKLVNTTPGENYNRTFYKAVEFTKEYVKSNAITVDDKKYVEMSVTYDNMPAGTFTALEAVSGQRYRLKGLLNIVNGEVNDSVVNFTLKPGENGAATFYNVKSSFDTNTHNSLCVNVLKK